MMKRKVRVAVFVSGGGTNLQAILDASAAGKIPSAEIALVISNNAKAYALERAKNAGVHGIFVSRKKAGSQEAFEAKIVSLLEKYEIDLIVLAGFMSILSAEFTARYDHRILNIHPSLIPSFCGEGFYGLHVHEAALAKGVKVTGATVHFVNEIPDGGEIILQKAVEVLPEDTPEILQKRVMEQAEWKLLPKAVEMVAAKIREEKTMKILVVGGGGREHAIIKKLKESPKKPEIFALPGNGGIARDATCVDIGAKDIEGIVKFASENGIDYAVVAPDDPLVLGCVDALEAVGIPCFGPRKNAAIIEGSKVFSKDLMHKYGIPTAEYRVFTDMQEALAYLETAPVPTVVKADGLALGKGVIIAETREEAKNAVVSMMQDKKFGTAGNQIVIEEFLTGPEVSVLSFTDGKVVVPMVSSMDHKRAGDHDTGLNTGGMGTVAPNPYYTNEIAAECMQKIFLPTLNAMNAEGRTFKGCLYFGLMLTPKGPKVIEYNCRFGDPETQVVLPLLESDLLTVMQAVTNGTLADCEVKFSNGRAACVIMASEGYPSSYEKGYEITIPEDVEPNVYVAGAKTENDKLLTNGGRVLGVTATGDTLKQALEKSYAMVEKIHFDNEYYRHDIGARALAAGRNI